MYFDPLELMPWKLLASTLWSVGPLDPTRPSVGGVGPALLPEPPDPGQDNDGADRHQPSQSVEPNVALGAK